MPARRPTALLLALRRVQQSRSGTVAETAPQCWQASGVLGNCDEGTRRTAKYATFVNTKEPQRFIDTLLVSVKAGDGGSGASTFWGSVAKGRHQPADGGNGGPGGDVFVCASSRSDMQRLCLPSPCKVELLIKVSFLPSQRSLRGIRQVQRAENGGTGQRQKKRGRTGKDVTILVRACNLLVALCLSAAFIHLIVLLSSCSAAVLFIASATDTAEAGTCGNGSQQEEVSGRRSPCTCFR